MSAAGYSVGVFTGIVEELGEVVRLTEGAGDSALLAVRGPLVTSDARHGDSIDPDQGRHAYTDEAAADDSVSDG